MCIPFLFLVCFDWEQLSNTTDVKRALYIRNDPYETSDAVFGVKDSLVVDISRADAEIAKKYNVPEGHAALKYDFVLISDQETKSLREKKAVEALDKLGRKVKIVNGLPVPDLD